MKSLDSYNNTKYELCIMEKRLKLISNYGKKIDIEKKILNDTIMVQKEILCQMEQVLKKLNGVENKLYNEIVINGMKVSKAIEKIALEEEKDVSTLWKNYYPNVKKKIDELYLSISSESLE